MILEEVKKKILELVNFYLNDLMVSMCFLNLKIMVLGEVNSLGIKCFFNKCVILLEVFGMVGDFSFYVNWINILIIREEEGRCIYKCFNF